MKIRNFKESDYDEICVWWKCAGMDVPRLDLIPEESSFLAESDSHQPMALVSLYVFKNVVWVESVVGNPLVAKAERKEAVDALQNRIEGFARGLGAAVLVGYVDPHKESLKKRYEDLGYKMSKEVVLITKGL